MQDAEKLVWDILLPYRTKPTASSPLSLQNSVSLSISCRWRLQSAPPRCSVTPGDHKVLRKIASCLIPINLHQAQDKLIQNTLYSCHGACVTELTRTGLGETRFVVFNGITGQHVGRFAPALLGMLQACWRHGPWHPGSFGTI